MLLKNKQSKGLAGKSISTHSRIQICFVFAVDGHRSVKNRIQLLHDCCGRRSEQLALQTDGNNRDVASLHPRPAGISETDGIQRSHLCKRTPLVAPEKARLKYEHPNIIMKDNSGKSTHKMYFNKVQDIM